MLNWNKQAILAAALLVFGTTAYWLEYKHKPEKESKEEQNKKLFNLKDVSVKSVQVHDGQGHVFDIRCSDTTSTLCKPGENSKWELTQPSKLKADDGNANALVSALNNLSIGENIDLKEETAEKRASLLKEYGLDAATRALPGTRKVAVETASGTTVLYFGQPHPIGDTIFGLAENTSGAEKPANKPDENKVYLVPSFFKTNFDHDLTYWRDKKLLTASAHEVESFNLSSSKIQVKGVRKDAQWTLTTVKEGEVSGDIENIDNLLTAATFLTAKNFVSDNKSDAKARAALQGAKAVVTLTMQQEKGAAKEQPAPLVLTLFQKGAAKGGTLYATVSNVDPVYELEPNALDRLNKDLKDLRLTKLITSMERFAIKKIEASGKSLGETLVVKDQAGKWGAEGPEAAKTPVSNDRVQNLLDKVSGNRIQEFVSGAAIPAGENEGLTLKLFDEKGELKRQLVFWKNGEKLFARDLSSKRKEAYRIDPAVGEALPWTRDAFAPKAETPPPPPMGGPGAPPLPPGFPGAGGPAGAPPEPGKPLIPQPAHKGDPHKK